MKNIEPDLQQQEILIPDVSSHQVFTDDLIVNNREIYSVYKDKSPIQLFIMECLYYRVQTFKEIYMQNEQPFIHTEYQTSSEDLSQDIQFTNFDTTISISAEVRQSAQIIDQIFNHNDENNENGNPANFVEINQSNLFLNLIQTNNSMNINHSNILNDQSNQLLNQFLEQNQANQNINSQQVPITQQQQSQLTISAHQQTVRPNYIQCNNNQ
ncbi:hypothetical protein ABPG74_000873 [Tetrahymena malaccensis]